MNFHPPPHDFPTKTASARGKVGRRAGGAAGQKAAVARRAVGQRRSTGGNVGLLQGERHEFN